MEVSARLPGAPVNIVGLEGEVDSRGRVLCDFCLDQTDNVRTVHPIDIEDGSRSVCERCGQVESSKTDGEKRREERKKEGKEKSMERPKDAVPVVVNAQSEYGEEFFRVLLPNRAGTIYVTDMETHVKETATARAVYLLQPARAKTRFKDLLAEMLRETDSF